MRSALTLVLGVALLGAVPATDPDRAFASARDAVSAAYYPHFASYDVTVRYRSGGREYVQGWTTFEDLRRRVVHAQTFSTDENAHPHVPHGINVAFGGVGPSGVQPAPDPLSRPYRPPQQDTQDTPLGMVSFGVNQDFGLARNVPPFTATANAHDVDPDTAGPPLIGTTHVDVKLYDVTLLGTEVEDGRTLVHLGLQPLRAPKANRLRELWLDEKTGLPLRALVAGIGNAPPWNEVEWRVDYALEGGAPYLQRETALAPLVAKQGVADDVSISYDNVQTTAIPKGYERLGFGDRVGVTDP